MLELAIVGAVAACGYIGAPGWWVLPAAAAMTIAGWWRKVRLLRQHPQVPFSSKMITYLVVSIAINITAATLALLAGRIVKYLLQG
jgi:hypothetical protein